LLTGRPGRFTASQPTSIAVVAQARSDVTVLMRAH